MYKLAYIRRINLKINDGEEKNYIFGEYDDGEDVFTVLEFISNDQMQFKASMCRFVENFIDY